MPSDQLKTRLRQDVVALFDDGRAILLAEAEIDENAKTKETAKTPATAETGKAAERKGTARALYQGWYSRALPLVRQLLPERYQEFQELYKLEKRKEINSLTYTISDYLLGIQVTRGIYKEQVVDPLTAFTSKFQHQLLILRSAIDRIDSLLADIEGVLQAKLFESELATAEDLLKKQHLRASGAVAGVVLEAHLRSVCDHRGIKFRKRVPAISDYNDELKSANVLDTPTWRHIQRLSDIRNLCVHKKDRDPTADEVRDLISGAATVTSNVF